MLRIRLYRRRTGLDNPSPGWRAIACPDIFPGKIVRRDKKTLGRVPGWDLRLAMLSVRLGAARRDIVRGSSV